MARFVPVDRDTQFLFPPSVQEWLPEDWNRYRRIDGTVTFDVSADAIEDLIAAIAKAGKEVKP